MANPSARAGAEASSSSRSSSSSSASAAAPKAKLTCLCSPTNHPGSFRCSRHRTRLTPRSSSLPAGGAGDGVIRSGAGHGAGGRAKGRSVLRAHLLRLVSSSPPSSSSGREHRHRRRDFKPRPSRLGIVNA